MLRLLYALLLCILAAAVYRHCVVERGWLDFFAWMTAGGVVMAGVGAWLLGEWIQDRAKGKK